MSSGAVPSLLASGPDEVEHALQADQPMHQDAPAAHPLEGDTHRDPQLAAWDMGSDTESDDSLGDGTYAQTDHRL